MSFSRAKLAGEVAGRIDSGKTDNLARVVAAYLIETGAVSQLNSLSRDIMQLQKSTNHTIELTAVSAHSLLPEQTDDIKAAVRKISAGAGNIIINTRVDKSLIGGVRLEFANHLLDLSVRAKLNRLKRLTT